jgi:hypothetical protein
VSQTTVFCSGDSIISSIVCFGGFFDHCKRQATAWTELQQPLCPC